MNPPATLAATVTTSEASPSAQSDRPVMPWALLAIAVAIACAVLVVDSTLTADQRIALFIQSGVFP